MNKSAHDCVPYSWDSLLQDAQDSGDYSPEWLRRYADAISFLRSELGELKLGEHGLPDSRMFWALTNRAPWTRERVIWMASVVRGCKSGRNFEALRRELDHSQRFGSATCVLETVETFLDAGLSVDFGSLTRRGDGNASPDIALLHETSGERLILEVTRLGSPQVMRDALQKMNALAATVTRWALTDALPLRWAGRFEVYPLEEQPDLMSNWLRDAAQRARTGNRLEELVLPDHFELAYASDQCLSDLELWSKQRGLSVGEISGPHFEPRESTRVSQRVSAKVRQLPNDAPGVIVVYDSRVTPGDTKESEGLGDREAIHEIMVRYPSLLCIVLAARVSIDVPTTEVPTKLPKSMSLATRWPYPGSTLQYEILWNRSFALRHPRRIARAAYRALRAHHRRVHDGRSSNITILSESGNGSV